MQDFLMTAYYDGLTVEQAKAMYQSIYGKNITAKSVDIAKAKIKELTGKDWE